MSLLWEQMHRPIVSLQRCFPHAEGLCFLLLTGARLSTGQNGEQIIAPQSTVPATTRSREKPWCTLWRLSACRPLRSQGMVCLCGLGMSVTQWTSYLITLLLPISSWHCEWGWLGDSNMRWTTIPMPVAVPSVPHFPAMPRGCVFLCFLLEEYSAKHNASL